MVVLSGYNGIFCIKSAASPCIYCLRSYVFNSMHRVGLRRQLGNSHAGGHSVTHPPAQGQQGDHQGEQENAHTRMISA